MNLNKNATAIFVAVVLVLLGIMYCSGMMEFYDETQEEPEMEMEPEMEGEMAPEMESEMEMAPEMEPEMEMEMEPEMEMAPEEVMDATAPVSKGAKRPMKAEGELEYYGLV